MFKSDNSINTNKKITTYIDNLFLKLEPANSFLTSRKNCNQSEGKDCRYQIPWSDDEQAFKEAVISMGDLSSLADDMRRIGQNTPNNGRIHP